MRPGGHGEGPAPDPIPNSAVKTLSAYDTASQDAGKSVAARSHQPTPPQRRTTHTHAGWSSPVARQAHNLKVTGSNPVPATPNRRPAATQPGTYLPGHTAVRTPAIAIPATRPGRTCPAQACDLRQSHEFGQDPLCGSSPMKSRGLCREGVTVKFGFVAKHRQWLCEALGALLRRNTKIHTVVSRRCRMRIGVEDLEGGADLRAEIVALAPSDDALNSHADRSWVAAMLYDRDRRGGNITNCYVLGRAGFWRQFAPSIIERP